MKNDLVIKYIIVQAGGKGTRMLHLTENKPKCLISIKNKPMIFYLFEKFPDAKFLIIADYKKEVLKKYLEIYALKFNYQIIDSFKKGTLSGIKKSLEYVPANTPFLITWSDLIYWDNPIKSDLDFNYNYIGLSKKFTCRWRFKNNQFTQIKSRKYGVAGFFIFSNKSILKNIPIEGEFVKYLKGKKNFKPFDLVGVDEIGTYEKYLKIVKKFPPIRPFNEIKITKNAVIKIPLDEQGKKLSQYEINFYKKFKKHHFSFLPKIKKYEPLTFQKINGRSLFLFKKLEEKDKKNILNQIIEGLKKIHNSEKPIKAIKKNDDLAIIDKTWDRLMQIKSLIPYKNEDFFYINNKKCFNFLKKWPLLKNFMNFYYPKFYYPIHGDLTFSNTLLEIGTKKIYFIDPRGYYGNIKIFGDVDYDWAKVYYSLKGNYDQFNIKNFVLKINKTHIFLKINSNNWEDLENLFFNLIKSNKNKILFYHGIIWLSLTTYAWDNVDSILGAFYNGIYWLNIFYEQHKKTFR